MDPNLANAVLAGIGILVAVVLRILFRQRLPRLAIEFKNSEPFCQRTLIDANLTEGYWIRVRLRNKGRITAQNVTGKIVEVRNSEYELGFLSRPTELFWSEEKPVSILRPDEPQFLDILLKRADLPKKIGLRTQSGGKFLDKGNYYFRIEVYADGISPAKAHYRLNWITDNIDGVRLKRVRWLERLLVRLRFFL